VARLVAESLAYSDEASRAIARLITHDSDSTLRMPFIIERDTRELLGASLRYTPTRIIIIALARALPRLRGAYNASDL